MCYSLFSFAENVGIGVTFLILFPGAFVLGHIFVMWYFFFKKSPEQYKAIMLLGDEDEPEDEDLSGSEVDMKAAFKKKSVMNS